MNATDGQIIAASLTEPVRFAGIFDRHIDSIRRYVARRLGASRGDDVISEVFRVAFESRETFQADADSALPWLYGIAANLVRRDHRSHSDLLASDGVHLRNQAAYDFYADSITSVWAGTPTGAIPTTE